MFVPDSHITLAEYLKVKPKYRHVELPVRHHSKGRLLAFLTNIMVRQSKQEPTCERPILEQDLNLAYKYYGVVK